MISMVANQIIKSRIPKRFSFSLQVNSLVIMIFLLIGQSKKMPLLLDLACLRLRLVLRHQKESATTFWSYGSPDSRKMEPRSSSTMPTMGIVSKNSSMVETHQTGKIALVLGSGNEIREKVVAKDFGLSQSTPWDFKSFWLLMTPTLWKTWPLQMKLSQHQSSCWKKLLTDRQKHQGSYGYHKSEWSSYYCCGEQIATKSLRQKSLSWITAVAENYL